MASNKLLRINYCPFDILAGIPGIGAEKAGRIIAMREAKGNVTQAMIESVLGGEIGRFFDYSPLTLEAQPVLSEPHMEPRPQQGLSSNTSKVPPLVGQGGLLFYEQYPPSPQEENQASGPAHGDPSGTPPTPAQGYGILLGSRLHQARDMGLLP